MVRQPGGGRGLTLVSAEAIEAANEEHPGLDVTPAATRRNVTVRGIDLDSLIGREFRVGELRCLGVRRAEPCAYLQGLIGRPILEALVHRAGLRADILEDGEIAVGDDVALAELAFPLTRRLDRRSPRPSVCPRQPATCRLAACPTA